jgi:predicted nuclease of restriction endonuclease-like (RecB) superfamily
MLVSRSRSPEAREFYHTEALRGGWSVRQLDRQIGILRNPSPRIQTHPPRRKTPRRRSRQNREAASQQKTCFERQRQSAKPESLKTNRWRSSAQL